MATPVRIKYNDVEHHDIPSTKGVAIDESALDPELHVAATIQDGIDLDEKEYKRVIRKVDLRLMPPLGLLYAWALIDRVNLSSVGYSLPDLAQALHLTFEADSNRRNGR